MSTQPDVYYNYKGINKLALGMAIAVIIAGFLLFLSAFFLPFGFALMVIGAIWAAVIVYMGRPTPENNHRL